MLNFVLSVNGVDLSEFTYVTAAGNAKRYGQGFYL